METVLDLLIRQVTTRAEKPACRWWNGRQWETSSWLELAADTGQLASQLQEAGVQPGDRVAILAENSYHWVLFDLALQAIRAVSVPLHTQLAAAQMGEQLQHSGARFIGVGSEPLYQRVAAELPSSGLSHREVFPFEFGLAGARPPVRVDRALASQPECRTAEEQLQGLGKLAAQVRPDDLLTVLYTSGTTGDPKGVMLTHRNIVANAHSKCATLPLGPEDVRLCWLPLSHIFARGCDLVTGLLAGCQTVISRGREHLFAECERFRPTYLNGVPYFFDRCYRELQQRGRLEEPDALRQLLGGRIRLCNCGGAPLAEHVFDFCQAQGVGLVTGYGLTEAAPVVTSNRPGAWRRGSVGRAIPGVEVRIAEDGEVLARGENVMSGYYRNPGATQRALRDGWLQTGDLGQLDEEGYLFLHGRKDDLIVLNTAKKVYPGELENLLLASPLLRQCCIFGQARNYLVALVAVDWEALSNRARADGKSLESTGWEQPLIRRELDRLLAGRAAHEQVRGFWIVPQPFSVEDGLLTAKQSLRRKQIFQRYAAELEQLYCR